MNNPHILIPIPDATIGRDSTRFAYFVYQPPDRPDDPRSPFPAGPYDTLAAVPQLLTELWRRGLARICWHRDTPDNREYWIARRGGFPL